MKHPRRVILEVEEIKGECPLYKVGDRITIEILPSTEVVNTEKSVRICLRALENIPFLLVYARAPNNVVEHLAGITGETRLACSMPGKPFTLCGHVIFSVRREV